MQDREREKKGGKMLKDAKHCPKQTGRAHMEY